MSRADELFIENCKEILAHGVWDTEQEVRPRWTDGAPAHTVKKFGIVNRYDLRAEFPVQTIRKMAFKSAVDELLWIWQKKSNNIHDLSSHIWDAWADESGSIGKAYGYQLGVKHRYPEGEFDQVDRVLYDLKHNPASRRILTSLYNHHDLSEMALYPCAWSVTFNVSGRTLNAVLNQRSQDMLTANGWNVMQYAGLVHFLARAAGLEAGVVSLTDHFSRPGFRVVEDRKIRCHKVGGHGSETFLQGAMNSCNPVFIDVGQRLGIDRYYDYFTQFGLREKTGIDLPGEAATIMHRKENMGLVELATVSFGQSFQITPIQLITTAASIINGGRRVTPHFGVMAVGADGSVIRRFSYPEGRRILSEETSQTMRYVLEQVVAEGSGKKAAVAGFRIGGKTATSEKLPRSLKKYISSFVGFAPAEDPQVIALITIDEPQGIYYGGTIAAPVIADIFQNILPYLGISRDTSREEES